MPPLFTYTYRYNDPTMTAPTPGRALVMAVGFVISPPGIGPKGGGRWAGLPRAIGPVRTRLYRPDDDVEMTLPNTDLHMSDSPFIVAGHRQGIFNLPEHPGWEFLRWTIADHVAYDADIAANGGAPDPRPLVIVPCGKSKAPTASPAGEMYRGTYSRLALRAATALTDRSDIRIISARWGLLPLDQVIEPYELRLGQPRSITAAKVRAQAAQQGLLNRRHVIVLAGHAYTELVRQVWPHALTPLADTGGIGYQQKRLARIARGEPLADIAVAPDRAQLELPLVVSG